MSKKAYHSLTAVAVAMSLAGTIQAEPLLGLTSDGNLIAFDSATPGTIDSSTPITGLEVGDVLGGIDYRPATGEIFALSTSSRFYTIDPASGVATVINSTPFTPGIIGPDFGLDFNPVPDRIRITTPSGQNFRMVPETGNFGFQDGTLAYVTGDPNFGTSPTIVASAYTNSTAPAPATTALFNIDSALNIVVLQNPPNDGGLVTIGPLGINVTNETTFDISGVTGVAYAATVLDGDTTSGLYTVDLTNGAATLVGTIGSGLVLRGLAVSRPASVSDWMVMTE